MRHSILFRIVISIFLIAFCVVTNSYAHDMDGDGKDDVISVSKDSSGVFVWRWIRSSDGILEETTFGSDKNVYPCPGNYLGTGTLLCYIDSDNFWTIRLNDGTTTRVNFGLPGVSFAPGADVNGDGITDLSKYLNRCSQIGKNCRTYPITGIFLMGPYLPDPSLQSGVYTSGLVNVFFMDADGDNDEDSCSAYPIPSHPTNFKVICKDVLSKKTTRNQTIGEIFARPIGLNVKGRPGYIVLSRTRSNTTDLTLIPKSGKRITTSIKTRGTILSDNWLGSSQSDQVGVVSGKTLAYFDPAARRLGELSVPEGEPIDTKTRLFGGDERNKLTTPIVKANLKKLGFSRR